MKGKIIYILLVVAITIFSGCGGSNETKTPSSIETGTVSGVIKDVAGNPIDGAKVTTGTSETTTDKDGRYTIAASPSAKVSITASHKNYAPNSKNTEVVLNQESNLDITLAVVDRVVVFNALDGASITTKGASVYLTANKFARQDGSPYTGSVTAKVSFNQVTSSVGAEAFPGDYIGVESNGSETVLQSYGFIDVTLEDSDGNPLQILADATLVYPLDPQLALDPNFEEPNDGDTIPLWYYDSERGAWIEDGSAFYDSVTQTFTGTVSHFTTWNLDAKVPRAVYKSCIEDALGKRVPTANVYLTTPGWSRVFTNNDVNGEFGFYNAPSGLTMKLRAKLGEYVSEEKTILLAAGEVRNDSECLQLNVDASTFFFSVSGKIIDQDGIAIQNAYIRLYDQNTYLGSISTDADGDFLSNEYLRPINGKVRLVISANSLEIEREYLIDDKNTITNIGTLEIRAMTVTGCVQRADGTTNFIDPRSYATAPAYPVQRVSSIYGNYTLANSIYIDRPYFNSIGDIDSNGQFTFTIEQNNLDREVFVFADDRTLTKQFTIEANQNTLDFSNQCLVLEPSIQINKPVEVRTVSANPDAYLGISFTYSGYYDTVDIDKNIIGFEYYDVDNNLIPAEKTQRTVFPLTDNGLYNIYQFTDYTYVNGTISVILNGTTYTVVIPENSTAYNWYGFIISVYQGKIEVIDINTEAIIPG